MESHPISLIHTGDLNRSRLTVFLRPLLVIPRLLWLLLYSMAAGTVHSIGWIAAIFSGQLPRGFHLLLRDHLQYMTRMTGYLNFLADPKPPYDSDVSYALTLTIPPSPAKQGRLGVIFRPLLALWAICVSIVISLGWFFTTVLAWLACLFTGRMPAGAQRFGLRALQFTSQLTAYFYLLTDQSPQWRTPVDDQSAKLVP